MRHHCLLFAVKKDALPGRESRWGMKSRKCLGKTYVYLLMNSVIKFHDSIFWKRPWTSVISFSSCGPFAIDISTHLEPSVVWTTKSQNPLTSSSTGYVMRGCFIIGCSSKKLCFWGPTFSEGWDGERGIWDTFREYWEIDIGTIITWEQGCPWRCNTGRCKTVILKCRYLHMTYWGDIFPLEILVILPSQTHWATGPFVYESPSYKTNSHYYHKTAKLLPSAYHFHLIGFIPFLSKCMF